MLTVDKNMVTKYVKKIFIKFRSIYKCCSGFSLYCFKCLQQEFITRIDYTGLLDILGDSERFVLRFNSEDGQHYVRASWVEDIDMPWQYEFGLNFNNFVIKFLL